MDTEAAEKQNEELSLIVVNKGRNSNIELLRIISMIVIIAHHFELYTEYRTTSNINLIIYSLGNLGVNIFVIISGYFLITSKFSIKKLLKLWLQIIFYSIGIMLILNVLHITNTTPKQFIKSFLPVTYGNYWFASTYVILYLIYPYLNKLVNNISKITYRNLLVILAFIFSILYSIMYKSSNLISGVGGELVWFVFLYLLAGYIRLYGIKFLENKKRNIILTIVFTLLYFTLLCVSQYIYSKFGRLGHIATYYMKMNSIFLLAIGIGTFYIFKNMNPRQSKIVNSIAGVTFAVYLIHEHELFRMPIWNFVKEFMESKNVNEMVIIIGCILLFFIVAYILERNKESYRKIYF